MKIRPKNIPMFQNGGVPQWYLDIYGNRNFLIDWDLNKNYSRANQNLLDNDHRHAGDLETAYQKNIAYTGTPTAVSSDIQAFYDSDGKGMSAAEFVNYYNNKAQEIRNHWALNQRYNAPSAGEHNPLFRRMFKSRSDQTLGVKNPYNIGYLEDLEKIEGSSTWLRRMDRYETEFDFSNPDKNRLHELTLSNGEKVMVYKKANGDIGIFNTTEGTTRATEDGYEANTVDEKLNAQPEDLKVTPEDTESDTGGRKLNPEDAPDSKWHNILGKMKSVFSNVINNPDFIETGRLAGQLISNSRIYDEALKGIRPELMQSYHTHRQVVGDEATKLAYYRRAAQGQTKAARPFTSDADRQMAYQMEAKRIGDELRALGDLADNQEIRRTSDESNQHLWANTLRDTEVANYNRKSLIQANALKHNLLALKKAALWASIDTFLQGVEYRKRKQLAEQLALNDLIWLLQMENEMSTDPDVTAAYNKLNEAIKNATDDKNITNWLDKDVVNALKELEAAKNNLYIKILLKQKEYKQNGRNVSYDKSGGKVTKKRKDDFLYKTNRDTAEHFRKMSKMSSDAQNRKKPKIERLAPHPKGTRKYQLGGLAPFGVFRSVVYGGETTTESSFPNIFGDRGTKDKEKDKDDTGKKVLDMIKSVTDLIAGKGLPIDVDNLSALMNNFLMKYRLFGNKITTEEIASALWLFLNLALHMQNSYNEKNEAENSAISNAAMLEFAVTNTGAYVLLNVDTGEVEISKEFNKKGYVPITNAQLLNLREYSPQLLGEKGDTIIKNVVYNGMGLQKISEYIKSIAVNIGSTDAKIDNVTKVESDKIKAGLEQLLNAPEGYYNVSIETKELADLIEAALDYIENRALNESQKAILKAHGGIRKHILGALNMHKKSTYNVDITPLSVRAFDKDKDSSSKEKDSGVPSTFLDLVLRLQIGTPTNFGIITKNENTEFHAFDARQIAELPNVHSDMSIAEMLEKSNLGLGVKFNKRSITFGDLIIDPTNLKDIMFSEGNGATIVTLPCKYENGVQVVNFAIKDEFDDAILKASKKVDVDWTKPEFILALSEELQKKGLDSLLTSKMELDPNMVSLFVVVEGYTTDKVKFNKNSKYVEKILRPTKELEDRMNLALSMKGADGKVKSPGIDVKDWGILEFRYADVYHANVFIPISTNSLDAHIGGSGLSTSEARRLSEDQLTWEKVIKANSNNGLKI